MKKKNNREPIYALIYTNLRNQIFNGQLSAGDLLPSENQLSSNYKVSRETVRRGLKALESEGLIYSRPKVGYFVSLPNYSDVTVSFTVNPTDCRTHYKDIHAVMPDAEVRKILNIPEDRIVIELSQVTDSVEGTPVAYDIKYILYEQAYPSVESEIRFAVFPELTLPKMAAFSYYTDVQIRAVGASEAVAKVLECRIGEPLLLVERIYIQQNGKRIGYALHYSRQPYGALKGTSGYRL